MLFETSRRADLALPAKYSVGGLMRDVVIALVPGTTLYIALFGWGVLTNILLSITLALACESVALLLRKRSIKVALSDYSALLSAWLFALALPPMSSVWLIAVGVGFAILIAKHAYGGLGYNVFNPAMVGYVVVLIAFPKEMTQWLAPASLTSTSLGFIDTLLFVLTGNLPSSVAWDAMTQATPLDAIKTGLSQSLDVATVQQQLGLGHWTAHGWGWIALMWLLGGLWLLYRRVISWHIPLGLIAAMWILSSIFHWLDVQYHGAPLLQLASGGVILGAFFIATDPVTAPSSNAGRLLYGGLIGALAYIIRTWGGYPEGIAFAVLLGNLCAPTIDYYFRPRTYGHPK